MLTRDLVEQLRWQVAAMRWIESEISIFGKWAPDWSLESHPSKIAKGGVLGKPVRSAEADSLCSTFVFPALTRWLTNAAASRLVNVSYYRSGFPRVS